MHPSEHDVLLTRRQFVAVGAIGSAAVAIGCHGSEKQGSWDFLSEHTHARLLLFAIRSSPQTIFPALRRPESLPTSTGSWRAIISAIRTLIVTVLRRPMS